MPWSRFELFLAQIRRDVFIRRPFHGNALKLLRQGRLEIGRGTVLESNVTIHSDRGRVRLGEGVYLSRGVTIGSVDLVEIGDYALIGPGCYITDGDHRHSDMSLPVPDQGMVSRGPAILEDNVWLGANVVVTSGVVIGRRSVVGANSVVTRDIPAFSVAAGVPAKVVASTGSAVGWASLPGFAGGLATIASLPASGPGRQRQPAPGPRREIPAAARQTAGQTARPAAGSCG